jgi:hypothetical protein
MSELSESFHLRSDSQLDAVRLLDSTSTRGFVFGPKRGWVAFVCGALPADVAAASAARPELPREVAEWIALGTATKAAAARIVSANTSTLLSYSFAADHGCSLDLLEGSIVAGRIEVSFEDGGSRFDEAPFVQRAVLSQAACTELRAWLDNASSFHDRQLGMLEAQVAAKDEDLRAGLHERYLADRYFLARIAGLVDYAWLNFESQLQASHAPNRIAVRVPDVRT